MADPALDVKARSSELRDRVMAVIQRKMKRKGASISEDQKDKDRESAILRLTVIAAQRASATISFQVRCGNDDDAPAETEPVEVDLRILKQFIGEFDLDLMARVFEVELDLWGNCGGDEEEDLALLATTLRSTGPQTVKLHLTAFCSPVADLTHDPDPPRGLSGLHGATLKTLVLEYEFDDYDDNDANAIIDYVDTRAMHGVDWAKVTLNGCGRNANEISNLVSKIAQISSLELNFNDVFSPSNRVPTMPGAAEWSKLTELKKLKHLKIVGRPSGPAPNGIPSLPSWLQKSQSLETLVLKNADAGRDFFNAFPQLTKLCIEHYLGRGVTQGYSTKTIKEVIAELRKNNCQLSELESLELRGPDLASMGGCDIMRDLCNAIVENYKLHCPKLQTLIFDFTFPVQGNGDENILQFLSNQKFNDQALSKAPLKIVMSKALLTIDNLSNSQAVNLAKIKHAIKQLTVEVVQSGLQFLTLEWNITNCVVSRSQLDDILESIKADHRQRTDPLLEDLDIDKLPVPDNEPRLGNFVKTIRHVVWKTSNVKGFEQRIDLTHWGPAAEEDENPREPPPKKRKENGD